MGAGACCEALAKCFMDEGDIILMPEPCYIGFEHDFEKIASVDIQTFKWDGFEIFRESANEKSQNLRVTSTILEEALNLCKDKKKQIKCLLITNPDNPTGNMLDKASMQACIEFCNKHNLHFISDEIYMASIHDTTAEFSSVLQLGPQSDNIHFIWSFSKDFGVSGFRVGVIVTKNSVFKNYAQNDNNQMVSTVAQYSMESLITDFHWLNDIYLPENRRRLRERYEYVRNELANVAIPCFPASGGLFLWANFSQLMHNSSYEEEDKLFEAFIGAGICMLPASVCKSSLYGHFRIVFSLQWDVLKVAMNRLKTTVLSLRKVKWQHRN